MVLSLCFPGHYSNLRKERIKTGANAKEDVRFLKAVAEKANPKNEMEFPACLSSFDNETKLKALLFVASIAFMNVSDCTGLEGVELIPFFHKSVVDPQFEKISACVSVFLFSRGDGEDRIKVANSQVSDLQSLLFVTRQACILRIALFCC
jgi:hypothetical protein